MASVQKYLSDLLEEHCRDHIESNMGINPDDDKEEFEEELRDQIQLMEMSIYRDSNIIENAYYMEVPKKALYRFGYTKEEINREFSDIFAEDEYPY
jgi:hypothetical protein